MNLFSQFSYTGFQGPNGITLESSKKKGLPDSFQRVCFQRPYQTRGGHGQQHACTATKSVKSAPKGGELKATNVQPKAVTKPRQSGRGMRCDYAPTWPTKVNKTDGIWIPKQMHIGTSHAEGNKGNNRPSFGRTLVKV